MSAPRPRPFDIDVRDEDGARVLALAGELDLAGAPLLEVELARAEGLRGAVVLDVTELEFMDSTGIRLFFEATERAQQSGRSLSIQGMSAPLRRTFQIVGLLDVLPLRD
jgi:anti-sigma B factor antagonist